MLVAATCFFGSRYYNYYREKYDGIFGGFWVEIPKMIPISCYKSFKMHKDIGTPNLTLPGICSGYVQGDNKKHCWGTEVKGSKVRESEVRVKLDTLTTDKVATNELNRVRLTGVRQSLFILFSLLLILIINNYYHQ